MVLTFTGVLVYLFSVCINPLKNIRFMKKNLLLAAIGMLCTQELYAQNVGIGTTTPTHQLHTTGSVRFQEISGMGNRVVQVNDSGRLFTRTAPIAAQNTTPVSIPDNGCPTDNYASSDITLSGLPTSIDPKSVSVELNITHTYAEDLTLLLAAPNGQVVILKNSGTTGGQNFTNTVISGNGIVPLYTVGPPFTGTFAADGGSSILCSTYWDLVDGFGRLGNGDINPNGLWSLIIYDCAVQDVGTLNNWKISIAPSERLVVKDLIATENTYLKGNLAIQGGSPGMGKVLTSDSAGNAKWHTQQIAFKAVPEGDLVQASGATIAPVLFNTTQSSVGTYKDYSGFANNCFNFTGSTGFSAPEAGVYNFEVNLMLNFATATQTGTIDLYLEVSGQTIFLNRVRIANGATTPLYISGSYTGLLSQGNSVKVQFSQNIGVPITVAKNGAAFSGFKIQ